jgi:hypothetical protein
MTTSAALQPRTTLLISTLYTLTLTLFCPLLTATTAQILFDTHSFDGQATALVCFAWAARNFTLWWRWQAQPVLTYLAQVAGLVM